MKKLLLLLFVLGLSTEALARGGGGSGVLLNVNAFMYNETYKYEGSVSAEGDGDTSIYDLKLGYLSNSWYVGALMTSRNEDPTGTGSSTGSATGISGGYFFGEGFFLMAHYIFSATEGDDYKKGTGLQFDFGYLANVSSNFQVGVELTRRSITYKENDTDSNFDSYVHTETFPMLTFGFIF